jgi:hypothetical protein
LFLIPEQHEITITFKDSVPDIRFSWTPPADLAEQRPIAALGKILEVRIPLNAFPKLPANHFQYLVIIEKNGQEIERWPSDAPFQLPIPNADIFVDTWNV